MTRLEQLRLDAGLTRRELGARVELSGRTIGNLESGLKGAHPASLKTLGEFFDVPASDLLRDALPVVEKAA